MMFNIIFMGSAGSGKGTQALLLKDELNVCHVSTGVILRSEIEKKTKMGIKINKYIAKGNLIPDDLMVDILEKRILEKDCKNGFILDGFPRNLNQAEALERLLGKLGKKIDFVFEIRVDRKTIIKRITGRFSCKKCKTVYNGYFSPTEVDGICDVCGSKKFEYRKDDSSEKSIERRLDIYEKETKPVVKFYKKKGIIYFVDGTGSAEVVNANIKKVLKLI